MNRADVVQFITVEFSQLADIANLPLTDDVSGISMQIDQALLMFGQSVDYFTANQILGTDILTFTTLIRYTVLARLRNKLATQVNISITTPGISRSKSDIFKNVDSLYQDVKKEVSNAGYDVTANDMLAIIVQLDFLP